jgi:hypothetical protein
LTVTVTRRTLTGDPGDLTQLAEAVGPELSLAPVAMPVRLADIGAQGRRAGALLV